MEFIVSFLIWNECLIQLKKELDPTEFSIWICPLNIQFNKNILQIYAPNQFALTWIKNKYLNNLNEIFQKIYGPNPPLIKLTVLKTPKKIFHNNSNTLIRKIFKKQNESTNIVHLQYYSNINKKYNFDNFIEGKSNQIAKSVAHQVANNLGQFFNPLVLYGKSGLGKTHLLHAIANCILSKKFNAKLIYINSDIFFENMVIALKNNSIEKFKIYYQSLDVLLIDDIHLISDVKYFQIECVNALNTILKNNQQTIFTSDRCPTEIKGLKSYLELNFIQELKVPIKSPELKTRIAILIQKAKENNILLSYEVALFIAKKSQVNIKELEKNLYKIITYSYFSNHKITINFVKNVFKKNFILKKKIITIMNIQKIVSQYYKIKISDLLIKNRSRSIVYPRQIAMAITKKLTNHSLLEIGKAFGKRDHTTVLYACRKITHLLQKNLNIKKDFLKLINILSA